MAKKKSAKQKKNQREKKLRIEYEERHGERIKRAQSLKEEQQELAEEIAAQTIKIPPYRRGH